MREETYGIMLLGRAVREIESKKEKLWEVGLVFPGD